MEILDTHVAQKQKANKIIRIRTLLATGAGFIPLPLLDAAGILTIQLWMLRDLAKLYDIPFKKHLAKSLVGTLVGNVGSTGLIKFIPGLGHLLGGGAVAVSGGAATYALGKVFAQHFDQGGTLLSFDPIKSREYFRAFYEEEIAAKTLQAKEASLQDFNAQALATTTALKKANDDLAATIAALQAQLAQGRAPVEASTATVAIPLAHGAGEVKISAVAAPEKKRRRFRWLRWLLVLLLLALAGGWLFRAGYLQKAFGKMFSKAKQATETSNPLAKAAANGQIAANKGASADSTAAQPEQTGATPPKQAAPEAPTAGTTTAETAGPTAAELNFPAESSEALLADYMSKPKSKFPKSFPLQAVRFAEGAADLDADARGQIEHIAALLVAYPEAKIKIYGHTDPHEGQAANRQLGRNRAKAIENLLKQQGIPGRRTSTNFLEASVPPGSPRGAEIEVLQR